MIELPFELAFYHSRIVSFNIAPQWLIAKNLF